MDTKQPVGPPVNSTPARPPEPVTLSGRFGSVARLDPARDAADLWHAFKGHDHIWTYISRHGPFSDEATFAAWLAERATLNDPYAFTVRDPDGRARGLLALLEIRPAMRVIEVGFIVYSPALQRTALPPKPNTYWRVMFSKRWVIGAMNGSAMRSMRPRAVLLCALASCSKAYSDST